MLQLANRIRDQHSQLKTTGYRGVAQWVLLALLTLLLSLLTNHYLHHLLAPYGLGWLLLELMAVVGALGVYRVVATIVNAKSYLGMEAHLTEIGTLLKYNSVAKSRLGSHGQEEEKSV